MGSKRVRRTIEQWQSIVAGQVASGLTGEEYCQREGLVRSVFSRWRTRLGASGSGVSERLRRREPMPFIEVGELSSQAGTRIRLELGAGIVLTIARG